MPAGGWASWGDVPTGEQNWLAGQIDIWENSIGYQIPITTAQQLQLVNAGVETQHDIGQYAMRNWGGEFASALQKMPWAQYGLDKDTYAAMAGTFGTEYKKITGADISKEALTQAFQNPRDPTGGLLTASQYSQQLMNDANIQKTFGWVKYGLDFSQWTQQKLSLRSAFGRDVTDAEASTILQYNRAATGSSATVIARPASPPQQPGTQPTGVAQSETR